MRILLTRPPARLEILADLEFEPPFRAFIRFKLPGLNFAQKMAMVTSMRVVVSQDPAIVGSVVVNVDEYDRISQH